MNEGPRSRRAARRARQRRRRRNTALGLTAGLLAVAATVWLVTGRGGGPADTADATPSHGGRTPAGTAAPAAAPSTAAAPAGRAEAAGTITLAFAGDVHFTGRTAGRLGADPALGPMTPVLSAADFAMVNLESAITERGVPQPKTYHFRTTPQALDALRRSGIDAVTMANNHSVDYGAQGLADSIDAKHHAPIPVVGIGADDTEAYRPYVTTVNGVRLAVVAASQVYDITNQNWRAGPGKPGIASALDRPRLLQAVRAARAQADVVVVYLHWGIEGQSCPGAEQKSIAADLSAAGATAVVGTHAHVMLGSGMLGPTYVAYGFGNFLWYGSSPYPHSDQTGVTTLTITHGRVAKAVFSPAVVDGQGVPEPQSGAAARTVTDRYAALRGCTGLTPAP
jgi:poly-gamma-glutamate capsule biosynthesis protein CapA/YwtB (metallophosphatase superfamily)